MVAKSVWRDGDGAEHREERDGVRRIAALGRWRRLGKRQLVGLHWYAVLARGRHEADVEALLERRGFVAVVPKWRMLRRANRYAKRQVELLKPVAPGYVLVGFRAAELRHGVPPWHRVFDITMVSSVLGLEDDGRAWRLSSNQVADFLFDNDARAIGVEPSSDAVSVEARLVVGQMVTVTHGAFVGHSVSVVRAGGADSVTVLLTLFGRQSEMDIDRAWVEPAEGA